MAAAAPQATLAERLRAAGEAARGAAGARAERARVVTVEGMECLKVRASGVKETSLVIVREPRNQAGAAGAVVGALVLGSGGAVVGVVLGGAAGAAAGIVPAIFTFGLSIPAGLAAGAGLGGLAGAGLTVPGAAAGGLAGLKVHAHRDELLSLGLGARARAEGSLARGRAAADAVVVDLRGRSDAARARAAAAVAAANEHLVQHVGAVRVMTLETLAAAQERAILGKNKALELASDSTVQVTAASAAAGAVTLGTAGAATGLVAGGLGGAAVGLVPALFTFGLSIPICAVVGSTCGTAAGAVAGGGAGLATGGAVGYGAYTRRAQVSASVQQAKSKVDGAAAFVKETAASSAGFVRARWAGATGGTATPTDSLSD